MAATKQSALTALSAAALTLPGMLPSAQAAQPVEKPEIDFQYARYQESSDRVAVNVYQGSAIAPIDQTGQLLTNWIVDTWSGATPVLTMPASAALVVSGASGISDVNSDHSASVNEPAIQVMTGASPGETRYGIQLGGSYFIDNLAFHATGSRSEEPDYLSHSYLLGMDWELNQKLTTLSLGFGQNFDKIEPSTRPLKEQRTNYHYQFGFSQIIDKKSLFRLGLNYTDNNGFLSHPYKKVYIQNLPDNSGLTSGGFDNVFFDNRPNNRHQGALSLGYIRYFSILDAALHLDYRFYNDSWDVISHTFETTWYQPVGGGWMIIPRIRYYSQTKAEFYQLFFPAPRADNFYTSDYRLAGFGSLSGGLKLSKDLINRNNIIETAKFEVGFEYTQHAADLQLGGNSGSDITDFNYFIATASVKIQF